jgi:hypothetical protein
MTTIRFKRFSDPLFLKRVGRPLLVKFLGNFAADFASMGVLLPADELDDNDYTSAAAAVLKNPEGLPPRFLETLTMLEEMSTAEGQEQIELALCESGRLPAFAPDSTREELALQAWLFDPVLVARLHHQRRILRLSTFEYFRATHPQPGPPSAPPGCVERLPELTEHIEDWIAAHHRGRRTTLIEPHQIEDEIWYVVRHGDTFKRAPKVEERKTDVVHYRPARWDVVVFSPRRKELRVHARTRGERELYRRKFGLVLGGHEEHFCQRENYTLEPLRTEGPACLETEGLPGIEHITLREVRIAFPNLERQAITFRVRDVFACIAENPDRNALFHSGTLDRAVFQVRFADSPRPRTVSIILPNILKLTRHADAPIIGCWLEHAGLTWSAQSLAA